MYRVALNTAITTFKKDKRQPDRSGISFETLQMAEEIYDTETEEQIRMLLILLFLEDKKYEEIAEITGITQNYVRVKMNRIKKKLKLLMNTEG